MYNYRITISFSGWNTLAESRRESILLGCESRVGIVHRIIDLVLLRHKIFPILTMPSLLFPQFRSLLHERQLERHQGIQNTRRHVFVHGGRDRGPSRPGLGSPWPRKRERFSSGRQQRRRYWCHAESGSRAKSGASRIGYDASRSIYQLIFLITRISTSLLIMVVIFSVINIYCSTN